MAAKRKLTAEKAAAAISEMIANDEVKTPAEAVQKKPELKPGLTQFEDDRPVTRGSGPPVLERRSF